MRLTKFLLFLIFLAFTFSLISCAQMTGPEQGALIKITARRIAFHGYKINPDLFTSIGEIASASCQDTSGLAKPADVAFSIIFKAITTKTSDPLLAQDIQDIIELLGIKFDPSFQLVGITPERLKFITLFVCSFDQGIQAAKTTSK